jgi:hypothetical protein
MNARPTVDPRTGVIRWAPQRRGVPMGPAPMGGRLFTLGDIPAATGAAGPLIAPYTEGDIYNPPGLTPSSSSGSVAASTAGTSNPGETGYLPQSSPYGESDRPWSNPTTFATVPINAATNTQVPVLTQNYQRNALIIQNGSLATVSGDVAPTLYVNFNAQPQIGSALALPPGVGIAWDIITPRDSIYIAFGPFTNTGGSVVIQGAVIGGTYSP